MGTKKFPLVTFPKNSSLSKWYKWRHTLTLNSDAVTSFWWDLRVKFMSMSLVSIQWGVSLLLRKVSWRLFFCFQCLRGQGIHSSYWQMPDLDGGPWNSRSHDFLHDHRVAWGKTSRVGKTSPVLNFLLFVSLSGAIDSLFIQSGITIKSHSDIIFLFCQHFIVQTRFVQYFYNIFITLNDLFSHINNV